MKIEPAGHYILVKPDELTSLEQKELQKYEHLQKSGFSVNDLQDKKRKEKAINVGTLVAVGINAWKGFDDGIPWAKVGDKVYFAKYGGFEIEQDGQVLRLMADEDIVGIIREGAA
jgi:co-chaperonin GroES (HSP10)